MVGPSPLGTGLHDAGPGPGDHEPSGLGEVAGQLSRLRVEGIVSGRAGRSEDRHLRGVFEGGEHGEGGAHLLQGPRGDLQVEAVGAVPGQALSGAQDVAQHVTVGGGTRLLEELLHEIVGHRCSAWHGYRVGVATCDRCGASDPADADGAGLPLGWSLETTTRGFGRLCGRCTRAHVRDIEAKLDDDWWS